MSTLTIRLSNEQYEQIKLSAEKRNISVNKLMDKLVTIALTNYETQKRFEFRPHRSHAQWALDLLDNN